MDQFISYTMYFGRTMPDSKFVSDEQVSKFLEDVVENYYDGYTVTDHIGYWKGHAESSFSIEVLVPADEVYNPTNAVPSKIFLIMQKYKLRFKQESVGLKIHPCLVVF